MLIFRILCYVFAAIALITGAMDLIFGLDNLKGSGAALSEAGYSDPMTDNAFRFFAGIWLGAGVLFLVLVRDLTRYKTPMLVLLAAAALGGLGRIASILEHGMPVAASGQTTVYIALTAEVILAPLMILWLATRYGR